MNIQIRNNIVRGGAASSIYNFNGYGVIIEGNHTDSSISYGFSTETIIANNLIRAVGGGVTKSRDYELRRLTWQKRKTM
ncbi:hypothetical protein BsIDN1_07500 [Bacillus safensis]|uniref:Right handed beta helix domain-containing protein n=1 Tax=Bacillus safensis TaxID=561879 RepID=A0A5S9M306_BACIA|nr:hypothetical protein BsIDN1_07500 [Bacillus safensis]